MNRAEDLLSGGARRILGRDLSDPELASFQKYLELIVKWQRVQRLVGSTEPAWIVESLFLDSLLFLRMLPEHVRSVADLGSGAGLPGIPMKIVSRRMSMALVEPRERRASFLSACVREIGLIDTRVIQQRAAELESSGERFEAVVMRCVGDPVALMSQAARLLLPGGIAVASGPPARRALDLGDWKETSGVRPGSTRRFTILRAPTGPHGSP